MAYKMTFKGKQLAFAALMILASIVFVGTASAATLTVDDSGGADYAGIQDAIDNATVGDTIFVYSGTYYEKVNINKQLILIGLDNGGGKPVVNGGGSGNIIMISASADGVNLDGFNVTNGNVGINIISNNNIITNNTVQNNRGNGGGRRGGAGSNVYGISLINSNHNIITDNIIQNNNGGTGGLKYGGNGGTGGNGYGIFLSDSYSNTITNNTVHNNNGGDGGPSRNCGPCKGGNGGIGYGIFLSDSYSNTITNNTVQNNNGGAGGGSNLGGTGSDGNSYGIYLYSSYNNAITKNIFQNNDGGAGSSGYGISLNDSYNNIITDNIVWNNNGGSSGGNGYGISLGSSYNNTITNNNVQNNNGGAGVNSGDPYAGTGGIGGSGYGISLGSSNNNTITNNTVQNNYGGKGGYGRGKAGIGANGYGISLNNSNNISIINNTVKNNHGGNGGGGYNGGRGGNGYGISLGSSNNSNITANIVQSNYGGVGGGGSHWGGTGGNGYGISLGSSYNNTITNNTVKSNYGGVGGGGYNWGKTGGNGYGIFLGSSNNNTITNNTVQSNYGGVGGGGSRRNGGTGGNGYGIFLGSSNNNTITNNIVQSNYGGVGGGGRRIGGTGGNGYGISLGSSNNNTITNNIVQSNYGGVGGVGRWAGTSGNGYGISFGSSNNIIIYNNYLNNSNNFYLSVSVNTWNTTKTLDTNIIGGPYLGGNLWANPGGTGYSQTCADADGDGMCDSPYIIDANNIDYLPLSTNFTLEAIPPTTTITLSGTLGNNGWYTSDVQATLNANDNEGGSGVKIIEYSFDGINWNTYIVPFAITDEGTTTVYYKSTDNAGNVESTKNQTINIDKTPPIITGAPTTSPNANGWYNTDVGIHFTASDTISGIDTVTPDTRISTEGVNQSITGTAVDKAGNSASTTVSGINIDKTQPQVTINTPANSGVYILNQILVANWYSIDSLSGIASETGTLPSGAPIDTGIVGAKTFTVNAADNASNTATQTASYTITYDFLGILPPIRTDNSSIFKLGRTVPVKFRIADANGNYVNTAVANITYQLITNDILGTIEKAVSTSAAIEGNTFRYDSMDNLYIFNLGTTGMNLGTYQLNINLDDGTVNAVRISLK